MQYFPELSSISSYNNVCIAYKTIMMGKFILILFHGVLKFLFFKSILANNGSIVNAEKYIK